MQRTYRDEQVRNLPLILCPRLTILLLALFNIAQRTVDDHTAEKDGVEPRERALESGNQAP